MNTCPCISLADLAESIKYGYTASATNIPIGPRFLRITDIVPDQIDWDSVPFCEIPDKDKQRYVLAPGDIVIARTGATVGYAKLIRDSHDAVFASYLVRIRINPKLAEPSYVGRIVESEVYKKFVKSRVGGAAQPNANAQVLASFCLPIPDRTVQIRIASILSAYDDLIENNRRRIKLLEESARLLYQEWFINFRFPGHEKTRFSNGLPEGWAIFSVPDVIDVNPGVSAIKGNEMLYVPMASLSETGMTADTSLFEWRTKSTSVRFKKNDVLLARITPCLENGKTGFAYFLDDGQIACGSTEFIILRGRKVSSYFTYCLSRSYDFRQTAIKSMTGSSGRQRVQPECFNDYKLLLPPTKILDDFDRFAANCFSQIQVLMKQNQKLAEARDLLLPRLMSGEIEV